jgi:phage anti-repressor protein
MSIVPAFSFAIAKKLFNQKSDFPVDFDDAWVWLEYSNKANAKRFLIENLEDGIDFLIIDELGTLAVPRPAEKISLSIEGFKNWGMMSRTPAGKIIRKHFIECERLLKESLAKKFGGWDKARLEGIQARRDFTDHIATFNPSGKDYAIATNSTYKGMFGKTAAEIKSERGLSPKKSARDAMTKVELAALKLAELTVAEREHRSLYELKEDSFIQAQAFSKAITRNN